MLLAATLIMCLAGCESMGEPYTDDLEVLSFSVSDENPFPGASITFSVTVKNTGAFTINTLRRTIFISTDSGAYYSSTIGSADISPLAPGETETETFSIIARTDTYYACVFGNCSDAISVKVRAITAPHSPTPSDGRTSVSNTGTLVFGKAINAPVNALYYLDLGTNSSFSSSSTTIYNLGSDASAIDYTLRSNTQYYWRVRVSDGSTILATSDTWDFTTAN